MNIFASKEIQMPLKRRHQIPSDLAEKINILNVNSKQPVLIRKVGTNDIQPHLFKYRTLINSVKKHLPLLSKHIPYPHLFIVSDQQGIILHVEGPNHILNRARSFQLIPGSSLSMKDAGINAVSLAMTLNEGVIVEKEEHSLSIFKEWSCICFPIRIGEQTRGFLDLSYHITGDVGLKAGVLQSLVTRISDDLMLYDHDFQFKILRERLSPYRLTPRETDVAIGWLTLQSTAGIAHELGISEGTVRNLIKIIYRKTKINSKTKFIETFLL